MTDRLARAGAATLVAALVCRCTCALADDEEQRKDSGRYIEHAIVVGAGGAAELELADGSLHAGANVMIEWDAIEDWLELEIEASILAADSGTETPIGLTLKKPFRIARGAEVMVGAGPEVVSVHTPATKGTFFGGQVVLDFMFWPTRRLGLWIEPSCDLVARDRLSTAIGGTGGLLVGW